MGGVLRHGTVDVILLEGTPDHVPWEHRLLFLIKYHLRSHLVCMGVFESAIDPARLIVNRHRKKVFFEL